MPDLLHPTLHTERALPVLDTLPRPLFARAETLAAGTFSAVHQASLGAAFLRH